MDEKPEVAAEAPPTEVETPTETAPETPKEETVAEILSQEPKPNLVPEAALIGEKKGRKEAEKRVKELEAQIAQGATRQEVSGDIDQILNEYGLDDTNREFFNKLVKAVEAKAEAKAEEKLKPIQEKERQARLNEVFKTHFDQAMNQFPDLQGVVNANVIKTLSLAPENADKTFVQIIEETYGGTVAGKRTIETTTPGGGKAPEPIDYERAARDTEYLNKEILSDPKRREEYNQDLVRRLQL